jgi:hypothetical protein
MKNSKPWILVNDQPPKRGENVWYFFEVTGISAGQYLGNGPDGLPTFGGNGVWLGGDVTHWMLRVSSDLPPEIPPGYSRAERCLYHGNHMPFDCVDTWKNGTSTSPAKPPEDWAHAAARGIFQSLYDIYDPQFRMAMRGTPDGERAKIVARAADIIRMAQKQDQTSTLENTDQPVDNSPREGETYDFDLSFALPKPQDDPAKYVGDLMEGGFNSDCLGIGRSGCLGVMCSRTGASEEIARATVVAQIQRIIPGSRFVGQRR